MSVLVVFDTMVFLQQAAQPQRLHATFQCLYNGQATLCLSPALLGEVQDVLNRDTLRIKFPALTTEVVEAFVDDLFHRSRFFFPVPVSFTLPQHPDDDHLLNLTIHAQARYLVTWESRLLQLSSASDPTAVEFRRIAPSVTIVTPTKFAYALHGPPGSR